MTTTVEETIPVTPVGQRVLLRRINAEEWTASGLFIPDTAKEKSQQAEVLAIGTGARNDTGKKIPFQVSPGDRPWSSHTQMTEYCGVAVSCSTIRTRSGKFSRSAETTIQIGSQDFMPSSTN